MNEPKILIVDDRPENLVALKSVLDELEAEIMTASSGNEAVIKVIENEFALVLMDVQMPSMDGFETVKLMKQNMQTQCMPVIFISAIYNDEIYTIKGIEVGAVDFMTKPINASVLLGKARVFIDLYNHKKQLEQTAQQLEEELAKREKVENILRDNIKTLQQGLEISLAAEQHVRDLKAYQKFLAQAQGDIAKSKDILRNG